MKRYLAAKRCKKCKKILRANTDFFHRAPLNRDGLNHSCKTCENSRRKKEYDERVHFNMPKRCVICGDVFYASIAVINKLVKRGLKIYDLCSTPCRRTYAAQHPEYKLGSKGMSWNGKRKGDNNPNAVLTKEKVIEIREKIKAGMKVVDLVKEYGVTRSTIDSIKHYKTWKNVT